MKNPLVSIVSICWNRQAEILESLRHIYALDYDNYEVIVVDNYSTDGTVEAVAAMFPQTHLIQTEANIGIGAYNLGFSAAKGEYILILDDDSFPARESVGRMVRKFQDNPRLGVVAFDVRNDLYYDDVSVGEATAAAVHTDGDYMMGFNGAGAGIRRELFGRIGYYPEEFFLYLNEQDVAFRVWDNGYQIALCTDCVAYHKFSPKNRPSVRAPFYYTRNLFWLVWKHYPLGECLRLTIQCIYQCIYHSFEQRTTVYLKAMTNAFAHIEKPLAKRKPVSERVWKNMRVSFANSFTMFK